MDPMLALLLQLAALGVAVAGLAVKIGASSKRTETLIAERLAVITTKLEHHDGRQVQLSAAVEQARTERAKLDYHLGQLRERVALIEQGCRLHHRKEE